jgi:hypothetical protein
LKTPCFQGFFASSSFRLALPHIGTDRIRIFTASFIYMSKRLVLQPGFCKLLSF